MNELKTFKTQYAGRELEIQFGKFAHQTNSSCTVRYGDTVVLATVVLGKEKRDTDFFPLMVEFEEKMYAAGKIKGSRFIKREGRAGDEAILAGRLIDRGLRPLFNQKIRHDVQVIVTVLSLDEDNDPDVLGIIASSAALHISNIPFNGPIAGIRLGYENGEFIINPTYEQRKTSSLDFTVSGSSEKILMIEMEGKEIPENLLNEAFQKAMLEMKPIVDFINSIRKEIGQEKINENLLCYENLSDEENILAEKSKIFMIPLLEKYLFNIPVGTKKQRKEVLSNLKKETINFLNNEIGENNNFSSEKILNSIFEDFIEEQVSLAILNKNKRVDGRGIEDIRSLSGEVSILPRTHGSAIFQRGETQILSIVTLGAPGDEQTVDGMEEEFTKKYMHHYNDAPFSYGEAAPLRGIGRRAIGHGALAEKALEPVLPKEDEFPYTIRVVSEVMGSNGSSSMASICGSTLSLMNAGVPIKKQVAGIAIGMAQDKEGNWKTFTDLQDMEDGLGGMDFKVGGTRDGVTAIQMDTKTNGIDINIIKDALEKAQRARFKILDLLESIIKEPNKELSKYAPRIETFKINTEKIKDVIGPGGKMIKEIIEVTGVSIDIEDDGTVFVTSKESEGMKNAIKWIKDITRDFEVGEILEGKVSRIMAFGAIVQISPTQDGMVHISELDWKRVGRVEDIVKIGDLVKVKIIEKDPSGKLSLSIKALKERPKMEDKKVDTVNKEQPVVVDSKK